MLHHGQDSILQMVEAEDLPESVSYLTEIIGLDATLKLSGKCGGLSIYVPVDVVSDHWLTELIGEDALHKLSWTFKGEQIEVPRCHLAVLNARARVIHERHANGASVSALAAEFGMTKRGVRKAIGRVNSL